MRVSSGLGIQPKRARIPVSNLYEIMLFACALTKLQCDPNEVNESVMAIQMCNMNYFVRDNDHCP
jgi:hypothetical protein